MSQKAVIALKAELGLGPGATRKDIRQRFLTLALSLHPDKTNDPADIARYMRAKEAYTRLLQAMPPDRPILADKKDSFNKLKRCNTWSGDQKYAGTGEWRTQFGKRDGLEPMEAKYSSHDQFVVVDDDDERQLVYTRIAILATASLTSIIYYFMH